MTTPAEPAADPAALPDLAALVEAASQAAMQVAVAHRAKEHAEAVYNTLKAAAAIAFAGIRRRGLPSQEVLLPDGTKIALISIEKGADVITVDEALLEGIAALNNDTDFEDYAEPAALRDPKVLAFLAANFPHVVKRRLSAAARAQYDKEIWENKGKVWNRRTGELVEVATIEHLPATGKYSVRWEPKGKILLGDAIDAGIISQFGEITATQPANPDADPPALPQPDPVETADDGAPALEAPPPDPDSAEARMARARTKIFGPPAKGMKHPPTGEQSDILDAFATGANVAITAGAGTGKTTALKLLGHHGDEHGRRGRYVAFNRAIVDEAIESKEFPGSVAISTVHAMAKRAVGRPYQQRLDDRQHLPVKDQARILGVDGPVMIGDLKLAPYQQTRLAQSMVAEFCKSDDPEIGAHHVPWVNGLDSPDSVRQLQALLLPLATRAWANIQRTDRELASLAERGLRFDHAHYLKLWALRRPKLPVDYLLYDEAQDAAPVVLGVVLDQEQYGTQIIAVGDSNQAINGFTGAVDALSTFPARHRLSLTRSFRFGTPDAEITGEANKWLTLLGADLRLRGSDQIPSRIAPVETPDAVLCRTNAGAIGEVIGLMDAGRKVAMVGDKVADEIRALAEACISLKEGHGCTHPELFAFQTWAQVQDHAENDPTASGLSVLVRLVDKHGPEKIIKVSEALSEEADADVTVSTCHKAKGREWRRVRVGEFTLGEHLSDDTKRLAYVTVTRAQYDLDRGPLGDVDYYLRTVA